MKVVLTALTDVAEALRGEYEERGGKFYLKMDGDIPALMEANAKVVEFRDNNIKLTQEIEPLRALKAKYDGIDPDVARANITKLAEFEKKGLKGDEDIDAKLAKMLESAMQPVKDQLKAAQDREKQAELRADALTFNTSVGTKAKAVGAQESALEYLAGLAKNDFEIKDGQLVAKTGKFSKTKPGDALSLDEWLEDAVVTHAFAFAPSTGANVPGARVPAKPGEVALKPGQTILKNPTAQELGAHSKDILAGKVKVVNDPVTA